MVQKVAYLQAAQQIASQCTCARIRRVTRTVTRIYDDALKETGIHSSQLTLLTVAALYGDEGTGLGDLANALGVDRTTLSRSLRPLEKEGYLRVARSPLDQRRWLVILTRAGERAIENAFPSWERAQRSVKAKVGSRELETLHSAFGQLDSVLREP